MKTAFWAGKDLLVWRLVIPYSSMQLRSFTFLLESSGDGSWKGISYIHLYGWSQPHIFSKGIWCPAWLYMSSFGTMLPSTTLALWMICSTAPMMMQFVPAYSDFLNPIEEFFSAWRLKVYDHWSYDRMSPVEAMSAGCLAIGAGRNAKVGYIMQGHFSFCSLQGKTSNAM